MTISLEHPLQQSQLAADATDTTAAAGALDLTHQGNGVLRVRDGLPSPATCWSPPP